MASIKDCKILRFATATDDRGSVTFVRELKDIPLEMRRVYYAYSVPRGKVRARHAHTREKQVLIALNGRIDVLIDDGKHRKTYRLDDPSKGLYIAPMVWRETSKFSKGAVLLAIVDDFLDEKEYIRDYAQFKKITSL